MLVMSRPPRLHHRSAEGLMLFKSPSPLVMTVMCTGSGQSYWYSAHVCTFPQLWTPSKKSRPYVHFHLVVSQNRGPLAWVSKEKAERKPPSWSRSPIWNTPNVASHRAKDRPEAPGWMGLSPAAFFVFFGEWGCPLLSLGIPGVSITLSLTGSDGYQR